MSGLSYFNTLTVLSDTSNGPAETCERLTQNTNVQHKILVNAVFNAYRLSSETAECNYNLGLGYLLYVLV